MNIKKRMAANFTQIFSHENVTRHLLLDNFDQLLILLTCHALYEFFC